MTSYKIKMKLSDLKGLKVFNYSSLSYLAMSLHNYAIYAKYANDKNIYAIINCKNIEKFQTALEELIEGDYIDDYEIEKKTDDYEGIEIKSICIDEYKE